MQKQFMAGATAFLSLALTQSTASAQAFHLQEATIAQVHAAIRSGQLTCLQLVQMYIKRARAYNGRKRGSWCG